jgi:putative NADH-flavin reductase
MRVTVFGATGGIGREVVQQAAAAGHQVTAVVRDPAKLDPAPAGVTVVRADVLDPASIQPALTDADAVVSALGPRGRGPTTICSAGVTSIATAMAAAGVRRLLVVSASGIVVDDADDFLTRAVVKPLLNRLLADGWADLRRMEDVVRGTDLDWTLVRPSRLVNAPRGEYRTRVGGNLRRGYNSRRADVADWIVRHLTDPAAIRDVVAVAN